MPLEVYHDSLVGSIEFELDCRAEDHDEAGRVAGLHTSYPRFYNRDLSDASPRYYHTSVVRRIRRWRVLIDEDKLRPWSRVTLGLFLDEKLKSLKDSEPRLVTGLTWTKFQGGRLVDHIHYKRYNVVALAEGRDGRDKIALAMRQIHYYRSGSTDCNLWKEVRTRLRTKLHSLKMWHRLHDDSLEKSYTPGGASWQRAKESFERQQAALDYTRRLQALPARDERAREERRARTQCAAASAPPLVARRVARRIV